MKSKSARKKTKKSVAKKGINWIAISSIITALATVSLACFAGAQIWETNKMISNQKKIDALSLGTTLIDIQEHYPMEACSDLDKKTTEEKIEWARELRAIFYSQNTNQSLSGCKDCVDIWITSIDTLNYLVILLQETPDMADYFSNEACSLKHNLEKIYEKIIWRNLGDPEGYDQD